MFSCYTKLQITRNIDIALSIVRKVSTCKSSANAQKETSFLQKSKKEVSFCALALITELNIYSA